MLFSVQYKLTYKVNCFYFQHCDDVEIVLSVQEDFLKHIESFIYQIYAVFIANFNTGGVWIVFARLWWRWGLVCVGGGAILYLFLFLA